LRVAAAQGLKAVPFPPKVLSGNRPKPILTYYEELIEVTDVQATPVETGFRIDWEGLKAVP
jgi:hypothetical protein